ncbi:unnamed protein product [Meloidogyne enterolobii]|uniref:Uncharacterized protein n=1 Tax=Meloidogyne enterolobii TaxID=390850 RepID=A0ACB1AKW5_MELEN
MKQIKRKKVNDNYKKKVPFTSEGIQQLITKLGEVKERERLASIRARLGKEVKQMKTKIKKGKNDQQVETATVKPELAPSEIKEENKQQVDVSSIKSKLDPKNDFQQVSTSSGKPKLALAVNPKVDPKDDFRGKIITAKWVWFNGSFQQNVLLKIDKDGKIEDIFKEGELLMIEEDAITDLGEMVC